ncbi:MAG: L,D-transpeptidase family protein [Bacteriovorax sp.]
MKTTLLSLIISVLSTQAIAATSIKEVRVFKSERRLELVTQDNQIFKTYKVMLGRNPEGRKTKEGDNKTPEGPYTLDFKNDTSRFHKSIHISYPNAQDILRARQSGVKPGGDIMLHGLPNDLFEIRGWLTSIAPDLDPLYYNEDVVRTNILNYDWTSGCIAVKDDEIDEIYSLLDVPTKIIINP